MVPQATLDQVTWANNVYDASLAEGNNADLRLFSLGPTMAASSRARRVSAGASTSSAPSARNSALAPQTTLVAIGDDESGVLLSRGKDLRLHRWAEAAPGTGHAGEDPAGA